ncbi:MAG: hypothetical protein WCO76_00225 [Planctomycetota bacterium]
MFTISEYAVLLFVQVWLAPRMMPAAPVVFKGLRMNCVLPVTLLFTRIPVPEPMELVADARIVTDMTLLLPEAFWNVYPLVPEALKIRAPTVGWFAVLVLLPIVTVPALVVLSGAGPKPNWNELVPPTLVAITNVSGVVPDEEVDQVVPLAL